MPEIYLPSLFLNSTQKGRNVRTLEINLDRGLFMPEVERMYCTVSQAVLPYAIINISKELYGNASFLHNGVEKTILEGSYLSLTELQNGINNAVPSGNYVVTANTSTNQVIITAPAGSTLTLSSNLAQELGFPPNTVIPGGTSIASSGPVFFNDILASGILVVCELDLQCTTFFNNIDNSNVLAQIPIASADIPGGVITYPRDVIPIHCPLVANKTVKKFNIRFVSPRDIYKDLVFMQGDASIVLLFTAVY
jgi:hypothetical protein